ncbi:MAG: heme-binding protein [Phycisphaerales bacterium]
MLATLLLALATTTGAELAQTPPAPGNAVHLAGAEVAVERDGDVIRSGRAIVDTPLPDGYPMPTAPGAIALKTYPVVRRAEITSSTNMALGTNAAFWPLFMHIKNRDIAMTSPVEMDLVGMTGEPGDAPEAWTMSFLYRTPDLGPTGEAGSVTVVDAPPVTVVAVGFTGSADVRSVGLRLGELEEWVEANLPAWEQAGEPRLLQYNGPNIPRRDRWGEVQIPVRPRAAEQDAPTGEDAAD